MTKKRINLLGFIISFIIILCGFVYIIGDFWIALAFTLTALCLVTGSVFAAQSITDNLSK